MSRPDLDQINVMFYNLGQIKEIQEAARVGLLTMADSPHGFLCTLCGAKVVAKEAHIEYHRVQRDLLAAVINVMRGSDG